MYKRFLLILLLGVALCLPLQAADDIYGPINRQDTLWNIAEKLRPAKNVTTQQVMIALYQKNPHAFTVNNISSLRKGAHLLSPTEAEVKRIKRKTAVKLVQRHNTRWKKRRFVKTNAPMPAELKQRLAAQKTGDEASTAATNVADAKDKQEQTKPENTSKSQQVAASTAAPADNSASQAKSAQTQSAQSSTPVATNIAATSAAANNATGDSNAAAESQLSAQLTEVQQELAQTKAENQRLKDEMLALKKAQAQTAAESKTNEDIQVQLDALKHELTELRTILTEKNNHIKVLQASLKDASAAIKSQHADNMRLYNKLKELSPESVAVMAANAANNAQSKPQLELAEVAKMPVAPNALTAAQADNSANSATKSNDAGIAKVWADEAPGGKPSAEVTTALQSGESVTLSQILSSQSPKPAVEQAEKQSGFSFSTSRPAAVSPVAWAAVLISFVFILFMIVRALLMQNELRRFEVDETAATS